MVVVTIAFCLALGKGRLHVTWNLEINVKLLLKNKKFKICVFQACLWSQFKKKKNAFHASLSKVDSGYFAIQRKKQEHCEILVI